jgi:hypothetical protein
MSSPTMKESTSQAHRDGQSDSKYPKWLTWFGAVVPGVFTAGLLFYAVIAENGPGWGALGVGLGVALAAATVGALLGFLFGIPVIRQKEQGSQQLSNDSYRPNTNLEQISDWLTKILVGVGLVQIGNVGGSVRRLIGSVGEGLGNSATARVVAATTIMMGTVWGFLLAYVVTRLQVTNEFRRYELEVVSREAAAIVAKDVRADIINQETADAKALVLVEEALNPSHSESPKFSQTDLQEAVRAASPAVKAQIFNRARAERKSAWPNQRRRIGRTVPVFRSLTDADESGRYHRSRAQLGYALKDKESPDYVEASAILSRAIEIREQAGGVQPLYEFNRAVCAIMLDRSNGHSPDDVRQRVFADLAVAARDVKIRNDVLQGDPVVGEWLGRNEVSLADVESEAYQA